MTSQPSTNLNTFLQAQRVSHNRTIASQIGNIDITTFSDHSIIADLPKINLEDKKYVVKE